MRRKVIETACEMADCFWESTGICCDLYSTEGELLYGCSCLQRGCAVCKGISNETGAGPVCEKIHLKAIRQAQQFGGRYIYSCPSELMFSVSVIIDRGSAAGALVAGPVRHISSEEFLESDFRVQHMSDTVRRKMLAQVAEIPFVEPARMNKISKQLFANAVFISDESREFFIAQNKNDQQNSISEFIHRLKKEGQVHPYPIAAEQELTKAISHGDRQEAARLLNEILGYIFFYTGGKQNLIQARVIELLVVLSRAAIQGGANVERVLDITERSMRELLRLKGLDDISQRLSEILNCYTGLVFDVAGIKHRNAIFEAVDYMQQNYARHITLNEVAEHIGYSHAYFSHIFKEEMSCSFRTYLNRLRIEKSKPLLLSGRFSVPEICEMTGFPDQSHFGKIFRQETGTSPGKYRKENRRIDIEKEHGII